MFESFGLCIQYKVHFDSQNHRNIMTYALVSWLSCVLRIKQINVELPEILSGDDLFQTLNRGQTAQPRLPLASLRAPSETSASSASPRPQDGQRHILR